MYSGLKKAAIRANENEELTEQEVQTYIRSGIYYMGFSSIESSELVLYSRR